MTHYHDRLVAGDFKPSGPAKPVRKAAARKRTKAIKKRASAKATRAA